jgi:hypothetical protein
MEETFNNHSSEKMDYYEEKRSNRLKRFIFGIF